MVGIGMHCTQLRFSKLPLPGKAQMEGEPAQAFQSPDGLGFHRTFQNIRVSVQVGELCFSLSLNECLCCLDESVLDESRMLVSGGDGVGPTLSFGCRD